MKTIIEEINSNDINENIIEKAASLLRKGEVVAFPTETVYGLGANAMNEEAIKKIFQAKGRPSDNPLIVHICNEEMLYFVADEISDIAKKLMEIFWPGPLTIVLKKKNCIPDIVTAGMNTVAVRFPNNKTAIQLIEKSKVPIAAPSANISGSPSPTTANHVIDDLDGRISMIIDGGQVEVGVESTVIDATKEKIAILRPGSITKEMIEQVLMQEIIEYKNITTNKDEKPKCPGMKYRHYAPKAQVILINGELSEISEKINNLLEKENLNTKIGIMATEQTKNKYNKDKFIVISVGDRDKKETIAQNLFATLRKFDELNVTKIYAEEIEEKGIGMAIMNRLRKASIGK